MNCNSVSKTIFYFCVLPVAFLFILENNMPKIIDHFWPVTVNPTASLKAINNLQIELCNLEIQLTKMLNSETHPGLLHYKEKMEPSLSAVQLQSQAVENYVQNYGPVKMEEIEKLVESLAETRQLLDQFSDIMENFDEIKIERLNKIKEYNDKVADLAGFWTQWELYKHMDHLADLNFILDKEQIELDSSPDLKSLHESIVLVGTLLQAFEKADKTANQVMNSVIKDAPHFSESEHSLSFTIANTNGSEIQITLPMLQKILRKRAASAIYQKNALQFGKVYEEIVMAIERVQKLIQKVIEHEKNAWKVVTNEILEKMNIINKLHEDAPKKFSLNIQMRMAHNLDDEDNKDE